MERENERKREREREKERERDREGGKERGGQHSACMLMLCSSAGALTPILCVRSALSPHFCCCFHVLLRACQQ